MGGVGDELSPCMVELREPLAHALERPRELSHLVGAPIDHRLVEAAGGDPLRSVLEPPQPAGKRPGSAVADHEGQEQRQRPGREQPAADELDVPERVVQRRRQEHDRSGRRRDRDLGVPLPTAVHGPVGAPQGQRDRSRSSGVRKRGVTRAGQIQPRSRSAS